MKSLPNLNTNTRLAIALGLSAFVHLTIIFIAYHWHADTRAPTNQARPLSVSLTAAPVTLNVVQPEPPATTPDKVEKHKEINEIDYSIDDTYFGADQLSQAPELLNSARHPLPAWPREVQGEVVFRLWIDKQGQVKRVQAMTEDLPPAFIKAMQHYYLGVKYAPGYRPGGQVNSMIDITLAVTLSE